VFTVALIGPDGAGKTTIGNRLPEALPVRAKYLYMGINPASSNVMLPTTRLAYGIKKLLGVPPDTGGPPQHSSRPAKASGGLTLMVNSLRKGSSLINRTAEEWYRQIWAWYYQRRGFVVVFDRHFFADYHAYDVSDAYNARTLSQRIHGFLLSQCYPKPDMVVLLDAPGEVLYARKGEGSVESLERRRREYLELRGLVGKFCVVDASKPEDEVLLDVTTCICNFYNTKTKR